jgi:AsmA protein
MTLSSLLRSKYLLRGVLIVLLLFGIVRLVGPYLIPTATVEREARAAVAALTGARLEVAGGSDFDFWPYPKVTMRNVRLVATGEGISQAPDLMAADEVSVTFSLIGAVFGSPAFDAFELRRPRVSIGWTPDGTLNWQRGGWLTAAVQAVSEGDQSQVSTTGQRRIGTVTVIDGTIHVDDRRRGEKYSISDLNGSIKWPSLGASLGITLKGVLNGEVFNWAMLCDQPLVLLAGQNAQMKTSFTADPLTANFEGIANLSGNAFLSGDLQVGTPSIRHLLAWRGTDIGAAGNLGRINVEAAITTAGHTAKLDKLKLGIEESNATGVLDIALPPRGLPRVGGTLAFDRIDLRALMTAFSPLPGDGGNEDEFDAHSIDEIRMDLRLSAGEAALEPFTLADLAAGIRIEEGKASLDIGDSQFMGGRMSGRVLLTERGLRGGGQLQMSLRDVDFAGIARTLSLGGPLPLGRGTADFALATEHPVATTTGADLTGHFRLNLMNGSVSGFDRAAFERLAGENSFFSMAEVAGGDFPFATADIEGKIDRGLAEITRARIEGDKVLTLSGIVPYRSGSLALAGTIAETQAQDSDVVKPTLNFFVGGSWPDPVISPVSVLTGNTGR